MTKPDLKGKTIEITGKRFLVLSCTFRQPGNGDAAGFALLLLTEKGQLHHTMVGIEPITLIDGPRPIAAGSFADLAHRTQVKSMIQEAAVADAAQGIAAAQWIERGTAPADADRGRAEWSRPPDDVVRRRVQRDPSKPLVEYDLRGVGGTGTSELPGPQQPRDPFDRVFDLPPSPPDRKLESGIKCTPELTGERGNTRAVDAPQGLDLYPHQAKAAEIALRGGERAEIKWVDQPMRMAESVSEREALVRIHGDGPVACAESINDAVARKQHAANVAAEQRAEAALEAAYWRFDAIRAQMPERDAFKMAVRLFGDEIAPATIAKTIPIKLPPAVADVITSAPKVVENAPRPKTPLQVDRNRFLGSVPIGSVGRCMCRPGDTCPMGKDPAVDRYGCSRADLSAAGHNWHHDKPGTDDGATVGTAEIPAITDERVPDARVLVLWENAHAGHNAIAHPVELQALCEEVNSHRRASTAHHNSRHMQALRDELAARDRRVKDLERRVGEAREIAKVSEREAIEHREARSTAEHRATTLAEELAGLRIDRDKLANAAGVIEHQLRDGIAQLHRDLDASREQVKILSDERTAIAREQAGLLASVARLESEIATLTKTPSVLPSLPAGTTESDGKLVDVQCGELGIERDPMVYALWVPRLVAERNQAREQVIALQRRIDGFNRTLSPVLPPNVIAVPTEPAPGPVSSVGVDAGRVIASWPDNVEPKRVD